MLELIFVCTVFAMLVSGIVLAINRTYIFLNNTKIQIRATNLAREGMEMMFNIRDTNRRKCSGKKDDFWLYLGSGANIDSHDHEAECDPNGKVFEKGIYAIKEGKNGSGDRLIYAEKLSGIDEDDFYTVEGFFKDNEDYNKARSGSMIAFTGTYTYLSGASLFTGEIGDLLGNGAQFYRIVHVYGIYCKTSNNPNEPADLECNQYKDPKEMRFCVKVFYKMGEGDHSSELCSIMTNFME